MADTNEKEKRKEVIKKYVDNCCRVLKIVDGPDLLRTIEHVNKYGITNKEHDAEEIERVLK